MIKYYPFELHTHTHHSDGAMSPRTLIERAKERGLSGLAITDHNTTSSFYDLNEYGKELGIVVIPGIEWTTFYGHITVLGGKARVSWREINMDNINEKIAEVVRGGDVVNIAHPKRAGSPLCTGCYFEYKINNYDNITGFEVWSNPRPSFNISNEIAKEEYDGLLNSGKRIACIYGDDWHDEKNNKKQYAMTYLGIIGEVNADNAIIALKNHRTFISTGVIINLILSGKDGNYGIGDSLPSGIYKLNIDVSYNKDYAETHNVEALNVVIEGTALDKVIKLEIKDNRVIIEKLEIKKGYLRLVVKGNIDNEYSTLLISSPIYQEEY